MDTFRYICRMRLIWIALLLQTTTNIVLCDEPDRVLYIRGVRVLVYQSTGNHQTLQPATILLHGGGWITGTVSFSRRRDFIAAMLNWSTIFAVDYTLKQGFPAMFQENLMVVKELLQNGRYYNVDTDNVFIMGQSSGGNIVAAISYELNRISFTPKFKAQFLFFSPLQAIDFNTSSYMRNSEDEHLGRELMIYLWAAYVQPSLTHPPPEMLQNKHQTVTILQQFRQSVGVHDNDSHGAEILANVLQRLSYWHRISETFRNPKFAPLMAESMAGLPPTVLYASRNDILLDDSIFYHRRLQAEGVEVDLVVDEEGYHGSIRATESGLIDLIIKHYRRMSKH